jgi:hypothetical protein
VNGKAQTLWGEPNEVILDPLARSLVSRVPEQTLNLPFRPCAISQCEGWGGGGQAETACQTSVGPDTPYLLVLVHLYMVP